MLSCACTSRSCPRTRGAKGRLARKEWHGQLTKYPSPTACRGRARCDCVDVRRPRSSDRALPVPVIHKHRNAHRGESTGDVQRVHVREGKKKSAKETHDATLAGCTCTSAPAHKGKMIRPRDPAIVMLPIHLPCSCPCTCRERSSSVKRGLMWHRLTVPGAYHEGEARDLEGT